MSIQELTRQMIIDELLMIGCVTGHMRVAEFVRKVYPKANSLPTTDCRFGMTTAIDDIRQHMDRNNDWSFVLSDALNNDVTIVNNADQCLVYDEPIGGHGITWKELQDWYDNGLYELDMGADMVTFMKNSLRDSPMERRFRGLTL